MIFARFAIAAALLLNGVAFTADGRALVSVSYDQSLRIWPLTGAPAPVDDRQLRELGLRVLAEAAAREASEAG